MNTSTHPSITDGNIEEIRGKKNRWQMEASWIQKYAQRRGSLSIKQMFSDDGWDKRYQIIKEIRMLLTSKDVRASTYFTIRVQDEIKDLRSILG